MRNITLLSYPSHFYLFLVIAEKTSMIAYYRFQPLSKSGKKSFLNP